MEREEWLTVDEVARRLKVHPESVRRWLNAGRLRGHLISRRAGCRIRAAEVDRFVTGRPAEPEEKAAA